MGELVMSDISQFEVRTFEPNQVIFDEGEAAQTVYILRKGAVEIRVGTRGDAPRVLITIKTGDIFGELALLENRSHRAAAVTTEKTEVLEVPRQDFLNRLDASDPVMKAVVNHLVSRLREMMSEEKSYGDVSWGELKE
ncbi:MAG: cyclic nucleotide-binding domain-containing protein [Rhodospirillales bacterium]|nr:cyclic nucleotide-binding domain-containing protein [Rhodospirillales bacterium]